MIVACPCCRARYRLDPASVGRTGRAVRCAGCGERWFVESAEESKDLPPLPAAAETTEAAEERWSPGWLVANLALLALAVVVLARNEIADQSAAMTAVYRHLGLPVELGPGVEFRKLASRQRREQGAPILVVSGEIANVSGQPRAVPPIRIGLLAADGREIDHARFDAPRPTLGPGEVAPFEVELEQPPPEAHDFSVSFAAPP